jgi:predicted phage baseplate assembly protein
VTLPAPSLDDRRFQDLVDEAKRLIPKYCPEWTNHNLSDPGVALIELFAWMTEITLFRVNQLPDRLYSKFLDLVGVEPFAPTPARCDLTFWLSSARDEPVVVPEGTEVATLPGDEGPIVFATEGPLRIVQPELVAYVTSAVASGVDAYVDRWDDFTYDRTAVPCFTSTPIRAGDAFYLGFSAPLAGNAVEMTVTAPIEGLGVDPSRPPLAWETWTGEAWIAAEVHGDTTGGLNRNGIVTLLLPNTHAPLTLAGHFAYWVRGRLLDPEPDQPPYRQSPELLTLTARTIGGTVVAQHGEHAGSEHLGYSTGNPDQRFVVRRTPVLDRRSNEFVQVVHDGVTTSWEEVPDFRSSGAADRHVTWSSYSGEVRFGPRIRYPDGVIRQLGAVPPEGAQILVSGYRFGGGSRGNVGSGTLSLLRTTIPYVARVENRRAAVGGVDPESVDNAKLRGPLSLRAGQRAVTAADYERLTLDAAPSIARARCLSPARPGGPVRLLVVPRVTSEPGELVLDDLAISDELLANIAAHLDGRRTVGSAIEVGTPYFQGVSVAARVNALPGRPLDSVRQRVIETLYRYISPIEGGPTWTGWPFGVDLNAGTVFQLLSGVDGVERVEEVLLFEADLRNLVRMGAARERIRLADDSLFMSFEHRVVVR